MSAAEVLAEVSGKFFGKVCGNIAACPEIPPANFREIIMYNPHNATELLRNKIP